MVEESARNARPDGPRYRILVVDDNRDAGETLAELLAINGFDSLFVDNCEAALAELRMFAPQLAILDLGLPCIDGYELARQMKALPEGSSLTLVALSGHVDESKDKAGAFARHMSKPVRIAELVETVNTLLGEPRS